MIQAKKAMEKKALQGLSGTIGDGRKRKLALLKDGVDLTAIESEWQKGEDMLSGHFALLNKEDVSVDELGMATEEMHGHTAGLKRLLPKKEGTTSKKKKGIEEDPSGKEKGKGNDGQNILGGQGVVDRDVEEKGQGKGQNNKGGQGKSNGQGKGDTEKGKGQKGDNQESTAEKGQNNKGGQDKSKGQGKGDTEKGKGQKGDNQAEKGTAPKGDNQETGKGNNKGNKGKEDGQEEGGQDMPKNETMTTEPLSNENGGWPLHHGQAT